MVELSQGDFARAARGGSLDLSDVEQFLLGISSQARSAVKRVHSQSVDEARTYLRTRFGQYFGGPADATARSYLSSFEAYVGWDATAESCEKGVQTLIDFLPEGAVRGRADIIFARDPDQFEPRVLLWDELRLSRESAEIIALPSLLAVEQRYGDNSVPFVDVWQLATGQRERVEADVARARDDDVREILRRVDA
jgi:hypothetical protein